MPRGDKTGPMGMGPMSGRAAGFCAGFDIPGYANSESFAGGFGRGRRLRRMSCGRGFGGAGFRRAGFGGQGFGGAGFGRGQGFRAQEVDRAYTSADERTFLEKQVALLENQLNNLKGRLSEFEDDTDE